MFSSVFYVQLKNWTLFEANCYILCGGEERDAGRNCFLWCFTHLS